MLNLRFRKLLLTAFMLLWSLSLFRCSDSVPKRTTMTLNNFYDVDLRIPSLTDVYVDQDVVFTNDVILTVEPDVSFFLYEGVRITVHGSLHCVGDFDSPIVFDSDNQVASWGSIVLDSITGDATISHVVVQNAEYGFIIQNCNSLIVFDDSKFEDNNDGVLVESSQTVNIQNSEFIRNRTGLYMNGSSKFILDNCVINDNIEYGMRIYSSNGSVVTGSRFQRNEIGIQCNVRDSTRFLHNEIVDNDHGIQYYNISRIRLLNNDIHANRSGILIAGHFRSGGGLDSIVNNNLDGNYEYALHFPDSSPLNPPYFPLIATNNWWGTTDSLAIAEMIRDGYDTYVADTVRFLPCASSSFSN